MAATHTCSVVRRSFLRRLKPIRTARESAPIPPPSLSVAPRFFLTTASSGAAVRLLSNCGHLTRHQNCDSREKDHSSMCLTHFSFCVSISMFVVRLFGTSKRRHLLRSLEAFNSLVPGLASAFVTAASKGERVNST